MINSNEDNIKTLVSIHNRRLQKLKEQKALYGATVNPQVILEIEDIEAEIAILTSQLEESGNKLRHSTMRSELRYFAYISETKVHQFYEQIIDSQESTVEQGNGGRTSLVRQLRKVVDYIYEHEVVVDLKDIITRDNTSSLNAFCYSLSGEFTVSDWDGWYSTSDPNRFEIIEEKRFGRRKIGSPIVTLKTQIKDYEVNLSCSLRHFGDMGGSSHGEDMYVIVPHSGNYPFFIGDISARLEGLVLLGGVRDKKIHGSPIYLFHKFSPDEMMPNGFPLHL